MRNLTVLLGWFFLVAEIAADPVWIDVRTEAEFRAGHLEGVNERIDFDRIGPGVAALNLPADTEIRLYCRSGNRAGIARQILLQQGYRHVQNVGSLEDARRLWQQEHP